MFTESLFETEFFTNQTLQKLALESKAIYQIQSFTYQLQTIKKLFDKLQKFIEQNEYHSENLSNEILRIIIILDEILKSIIAFEYSIPNEKWIDRLTNINTFFEKLPDCYLYLFEMFLWYKTVRDIMKGLMRDNPTETIESLKVNFKDKLVCSNIFYYPDSEDSSEKLKHPTANYAIPLSTIIFAITLQEQLKCRYKPESMEEKSVSY